ncbi:MAG: hypothetical protein U0M33_02295 [Lachnospiraceae bacterium]|nr:hypothetical protein [Lachnospiraceae bacterium]
MTKRITEEECRRLYKEYETPAHVIAHCDAVSRVAVTIAEHLNTCGFSFDIPLIRGAGLAHDVARVRDKHWEVGADILAGLGYQAEADIVRVHMRFDFHSFEELNETDMVCLGDRLVKEDRYVGLDERIDYILHKAPDDPAVIRRILAKKTETGHLIKQIEAAIGQTIDSLFSSYRQKG